jgi:hypothetical protein
LRLGANGALHLLGSVPSDAGLVCEAITSLKVFELSTARSIAICLLELQLREPVPSRGARAV